MVINFSLDLSEALYSELIAACADARCHKTEFAAQALEACLAARRLPRVPSGTVGPRLGSRERREPENMREMRAALAPTDIATTEELSFLEDLNI